ncbi:MAG: DsrE family protein [Saprospiraceae bacterium]|jgi:intracellular sulfur oxidation DsrE/DsrF family protein|nr:DsrE family protein [Saprospiraceae bacterium]MBL0026683.1 DsrE family protein [Saprospiraceae bacterium]
MKWNKLYSNRYFILLFLGMLPMYLAAQISKEQQAQIIKEERFAKVEPRLIYPLIKGGKMTGVIPVDFATNKPASGTKMNLVFDFTQSTGNNSQGSHVNEGLEEVARILNLHIAAGIKKEALKAVIVFHSGSITSLLNNEYYQKNYGSDNPNIDILNKFSQTGVKMVICGQSIQLRELNPDQFLSAMQFAVSARTTLSKYQKLGYILFNINASGN